MSNKNIREEIDSYEKGTSITLQLKKGKKITGQLELCTEDHMSVCLFTEDGYEYFDFEDIVTYNINYRCDEGIEARLKGLSPDLAPIILKLTSEGSLVGVAENCLCNIEKVFDERLKTVADRYNKNMKTMISVIALLSGILILTLIFL